MKTSINCLILPEVESVTVNHYDTRYSKAPRLQNDREEEYVAVQLSLKEAPSIFVYAHADDVHQLEKCPTMDDSMFTVCFTSMLSSAYAEIRRITPNSDGTAEVEEGGSGFCHTTTTGQKMYFWITENVYPPEKNWRERPRRPGGQSLF